MLLSTEIIKNYTDTKNKTYRNTNFSEIQSLYTADNVQNTPNLDTITNITEISNLIDEDIINSTIYKTPLEYYDGLNNEKGSTEIPKGTDGKGVYQDEEKNDINYSVIRPKWFWIESLKTWATFKKENNKTEFNLCLWNGISNFISLKEMLKDSEYGITTEIFDFYKKFYEKTGYDFSKFLINRLDNEIPYITQAMTGAEYLALENGEDIDSKEENKNLINLSQWSILLPFDTNFSQNDENTFQTIRVSRTAFYHFREFFSHDEESVEIREREIRNLSNYLFSSSNPFIFRTKAGFLGIYFYMNLPGPYFRNELYRTEENKTFLVKGGIYDYIYNKPAQENVIWDDNMDLINQTCQNFFGTGNDKTIINDWKNYTGRMNNTGEEKETAIRNFAQDSLYGSEKINTVDKEEKISLKISSNSIKLETNGFTGQGIVDRWDR